jgi:ABC-type sugar transport system substrate-binding protein
MDLIAEQLGVTVKKIGPQEVDLPAFVAAIEQEIPKKPDGMMVVGWDASLATAIDAAIDAGIPTITVDADVPNSKRIAFVGSDWYEQGVEQAKGVAPYIKDKTGKAVLTGFPGADNTVACLAGYTETLAKLAPGVTVEQTVYDSTANAQKVTEVIGNLLKSDDTIVAVAGSDSSTGPGIAQAIKEAGKVGVVWGSCVDAEPEHLQGVKDGALAVAVGQKRHFFTYYGVRMLFDYNHNGIQFTNDDKGAGITPIPSMVSTGFISANAENIDIMIEAQAAKAK